jgi:hypothetical protein
MTASITAMWATIILAALGAFFAGPGLGVLAGILGTTLVVVLAMRSRALRTRNLRAWSWQPLLPTPLLFGHPARRHPDATIAALETLLTSDEAVDGRRSGQSQRVLRRLQRGIRRDESLRAAACRSLRSKAPKEDRDELSATE